MKTLILLSIALISFNSSSQNSSWNQRLEESIYVTRMNEDHALKTIITITTGGFSLSDLDSIEYACLEDEAEAIFKIETLNAFQVAIYHLSAYNELNIELLLNAAISENTFSVGQSVPYFFP